MATVWRFVRAKNTYTWLDPAQLRAPATETDIGSVQDRDTLQDDNLTYLSVFLANKNDNYDHPQIQNDN